MPRISVLMPVKNGEAYLAEALDSVLIQSIKDFDILIIDDGSDDRTMEIIARYKSKKIKVIQQNHAGLVATLNTGIALLDCDFVARMDADDICFPYRLEHQLEFLDFTQADIVSCKTVQIDELGHVLGVSGVSDIAQTDPHWLPPKEPYLSHPFMFGRRDVFQAFPYRQAHLSEDADLCWRIFEHHRMAIQNDALGMYRLHTASVSALNIVNGRVQAYYAALAALNTIRRLKGREEVAYTVSMEQSKSAETIPKLINLFADQITKEEKHWLLAASAMKLLTLARWRGYKLERSDIEIAKSALKAVDVLRAENTEEAQFFITEAENEISIQQKDRNLLSTLARFLNKT